MSRNQTLSRAAGGNRGDRLVAHLRLGCPARFLSHILGLRDLAGGDVTVTTHMPVIMLNGDVVTDFIISATWIEPSENYPDGRIEIESLDLRYIISTLDRRRNGEDVQTTERAEES